MNKIKLISIVMIISIVLGGCGTLDTKQNNPGGNVGSSDEGSSKEDGSDEADNATDSQTDDENDSDTGEDTDAVTFKAEILETGASLLVAPTQESNEYKSSDKMTVHLTEVNITDQSGESITGDELKLGDIISITYNGMINESYPAQISASAIQVTGHNHIIDGYLAIIDDIYQEDPGLNGDISMIAFDTTEWVDVTQPEKEMILSQINKIYGLETREGTFDQLLEEGLIDNENLYFPKGILIKISKLKINEDKDVIKYAIEKWRSGLGAIGSDDAKAKFDGAKWNITKKDTWIS